MCKCIRAWVPDETVEGTHDQVPISCEEYIASLEAILHNLMQSSADSLSMVLDIKSREERKLRAQAAWSGAGGMVPTGQVVPIAQPGVPPQRAGEHL